MEKYGFIDINNGERSKGLKSPTEMLWFFLEDCWFVLKNRRKLNHARTIIVISFTALPVKLLIKLGLIKCEQLLWFGFFIHSDKAFRVFRVLLRLLSIGNEKIVLNSAYEIPLYVEKLNLARHKLTYIPLGDWKNVDLYDEKYEPGVDEPYYFAGGYTNRNYPGLIEAFRQLPHKLVIVGSYLNKELNDLTQLPDNIIVKKDIPKEEFESLLAKSKACILPLKNDTGASGHMVLLGYMRNKKGIIASDMEAMREYITHEESALLFKRAEKELPAIVRAIEDGHYDLKKLGENAYQQYLDNFTYPALSARLIAILENNQ